MRVVLASDDEAAVVDEVARLLSERGHHVLRLPKGIWGPVAIDAAQRVARGEADQAIVLCHTGTGVALAANKVRGVRAALCVDAQTATGARRWNDANVLALSLRLVTPHLAREIVGAWLDASYDGTEGTSLAALASLENGTEPGS